MIPGTIGWVALGVALVVFADLLIVELRRVFRELGRIRARVAAYRDLPIVSLAATTPGDLERLQAASEQVPLLVARAEAALRALHVLRS